MENAVIIIAVLVITCFAGLYIYKVKKSGKKCIGCPNSGKCGCNCSKK